MLALHNVLPQVFREAEDTPRIQDSQVWRVPELRFERGCRLCIQAESGGGKSSLLSFIYGNRNDYDGEILFDGADIRTFNTDTWCKIRTTRLALLPQEMRLFGELTVMENLQLKNRLTNHLTEKQLTELLERFNIADKANQLVRYLSIGQQQRVAIIRAICQPFDLILLDEPVSHLDTANNAIAAGIIEEAAAQQGAGIITTSVGNPLLLHNPKHYSL